MVTFVLILLCISLRIPDLPRIDNSLSRCCVWKQLGGHVADDLNVAFRLSLSGSWIERVVAGRARLLSSRRRTPPLAGMDF
jgi:hypothetical protein